MIAGKIEKFNFYFFMKILIIVFCSYGLLSCHSVKMNQNTDKLFFRFVVLADSRGDYKADPPKIIAEEVLGKITQKIVSLNPKPDFVIFNGDMVAKTAYRGNSNAVEKWKNIFLKPIKDKNISVFVAPGNHIIDQKTVENDDPMKYIPLFRKHFQADNPLNGPDKYKGVTYSFNKKNCHFVTVTSFTTHRGQDNTELTSKDFVQKKKDFEYLINKENRDWLLKDLKKDDSDFTIFFTHVPLFAVGPHYKDMKSLHAHKKERDMVANILTDDGVDLYIGAHEHLYARTLLGPSNPSFSGLKSNLLQIVVGSSGAPFSKASKREDMIFEKYVVDYEFLVADVRKNKIEFHVYNDNNDEIDSFIIKK